jgi:hypothetical protein
MQGKKGKEDWTIRDETGAVRTLQRAWHTNEHEAAIRMTHFAAAVFGSTLQRNDHVTLLSLQLPCIAFKPIDNYFYLCK